MKWTYGIQHKMAAAALLAVVLLAVMSNNLSERNLSRKLRTEFISMYEDRLVVEGYILEMSELMHRIAGVAGNSDAALPYIQAEINAPMARLDELAELYAATKLTAEEEKEFNNLRLILANISRHALAGDLPGCKTAAAEALNSLNALSDIQIAEGAGIKNRSIKIFNSGLSTSQFEMALLIIVAVLIQALIFSSQTLNQATPTGGHHLN